MSTLPQVLSPSGEVIRLITAEHLLQAAGIDDPRRASTAELAAFSDSADHLTGIAREAKGIVSDELVRTLDRSGSWTRRVDGFVIKAPSPEAGTTAYDTDTLREVLAALVATDVIDQEGADAALEPVPGTVAFTLEELMRILTALDGEADQPVHESAQDLVAHALSMVPATTYRQKHAGIKALLKVPAAREAIEACRVEVEPPKRKATVTRATS